MKSIHFSRPSASTLKKVLAAITGIILLWSRSTLSSLSPDSMLITEKVLSESSEQIESVSEATRGAITYCKKKRFFNYFHKLKTLTRTFFFLRLANRLCFFFEEGGIGMGFCADLWFWGCIYCRFILRNTSKNGSFFVKCLSICLLIKLVSGENFRSKNQKCARLTEIHYWVILCKKG